MPKVPKKQEEYYPEDGYDQDGYAYDEEASGGSSYPIEAELKQSNQKLILTADLQMETQDLDQLTQFLLEKVNACGAYVQSSSFYTRGESTRIYNAVIRIPSDAYSSFIEEIRGSGNTVRYSESVDDVTDSYTDTQARLSSLRAQYEKVLEFYDKEDLRTLAQLLTGE